MKQKNESVLNIFAENSTCTRRELVHRFAVTACAAAIPALVAACGASGGDSGSRDSGYSISFEITFSKPMNTASVEDAISISPADADTANAEITWSDSDTVMYYKTGVAGNATYTVTIGATAASAGGNMLDGNSDGTGGDPYGFTLPAV